MENQLQTTSKNNLTRFTPQLSKLLPAVSEPTAEIVKARHEGTMFYEMSERNSETAASLIVADLALITGLKIPVGDAFNRLIQLTAESLRNDYSFYTTKLMLLGIKKHAHVLTTGKEKSYGRYLSLEDIHQVMSEYSLEVFNANKEVDEFFQKQAGEIKLNEQDAQNKMRKLLQEKYESKDFECCYSDFNQLLRDKFLTEDALKKQAWNCIKSLKEKYIQLSQKIVAPGDSESIKPAIEKKNYHEKIQMLTDIEDEIKAQTATLFLKYMHEKGVVKLYEEIK